MPLLKSKPEKSRKLNRRKLSESTKSCFGITSIPLDEKSMSEIEQCYDVLSSILLKDVSGSKPSSRGAMNCVGQGRRFLFVGAIHCAPTFLYQSSMVF